MNLGPIGTDNMTCTLIVFDQNNSSWIRNVVDKHKLLCYKVKIKYSDYNIILIKLFI